MVWPTEYDTKLVEYDAMELPGQQLSAASAHSPLDYSLSLNVQMPAACQRLTGIIATIGQSCNDVETLKKMMAAGMNIALLNLSFGNQKENIDMIKILRQAAKEYSVLIGKPFPLAIAARLPGRKIRTGNIDNSISGPVELQTGKIVRLTTDDVFKNKCTSSVIYIDFIHFTDQLKKGDILLLDNETIQLKVEVKSNQTLTCKIERGGYLGSNRDVFVPNILLNVPNYSEKDKAFVDMAVHHQLDIIIHSFVDSADTIQELRKAMGQKGKNIAIVANIQTVYGYQNFHEILKVANGVMITRRELGSDISPKKVVVAQKTMIAQANEVNVPVCLCSRQLSSMIYNRIPLRSELLDIADCVLDGADALVLSSETAVGISPVDAVLNLARTCKEAEACVWTMRIYSNLVERTPIPCDQLTAVAMAAVLAAYRTIAATIIVVSATGKTAYLIAKYKPRCPIIAVTRYAYIARQMHLYRGIIPLIYEATPNSDWETDLESRVNFCIKWAMHSGFVRVGDPLVLVCDWNQNCEYNNTIRVLYASADIVV